MNIYDEQFNEDLEKRRKEFKDNIDELQFLIKSYRTSEKFQEIMNVVAKFNYLAPYNALLVDIQKPGASFVLNGKRWMDYHRRPKLNAQKLITLIPFGPVQCMFDYSDTEQIPGTIELPEQQLLDEFNNSFMKAKGENHKSEFDFLIGNLAVYGIFLDDNFNAANTYGGYLMVYDQQKLLLEVLKGQFIEHNSVFSISINRNQNDEAKFQTICHELGHLFCHHQWYDWKKRRILSRKEEEFEAETVSWLVCKRHNIHNPSEEYLATYTMDGIIPIYSIENIMKAVTEIEKMMAGPVNITDSLWYKEDKKFKETISKYREEIRKQIRRSINK